MSNVHLGLRPAVFNQHDHKAKVMGLIPNLRAIDLCRTFSSSVTSCTAYPALPFWNWGLSGKKWKNKKKEAGERRYVDQRNLPLWIHIWFFPSYENLLRYFQLQRWLHFTDGWKEAFIHCSLITNVSTTSEILDEEVKMFCQHQWIMIKMNDAFNEKRLMNTSPASLKGEFEAQGTEQLTTPPSPDRFLLPTLWSFLRLL